MLAYTCWAVLSLMLLSSPISLLYAWPITLVTLAIAQVFALRGVWSVRAHRERRRLDPVAARGLSVGLVAVALAAIAGIVFAWIPSTARVTGSSRRVLYAYCLSDEFAPGVFAVIFVAAVRAWYTRSPRHIGVVAALALSMWPMLALVRTFGVPMFDVDGHFAEYRPWVMQLYVVSVTVAGGAAIGLIRASCRMLDCPALDPLPPPARVVSGAP